MASHDGERAFHIAIERIDGHCVLVFEGELDLNAADGLWRGIEQVRTSGQPVILDLARTTFMDSSGIKVLLRAYTADGRGPETVTLRAPSDAVMHTLTLAGIASIFRIEREPA